MYENSSLLGLYAEFLNIRRSSEGGREASVGPFGRYNIELGQL